MTDHRESVARRLHDLVEPIHLVAYFCDDQTVELQSLGLRGYWDTYFAGRAAPLGLATAAVVDAVFYNFAPGEVARHIPRVWTVMTPEQALAGRQRGCTSALRRELGPLADRPGVARAADTLVRAAMSEPAHGRALFAGLQALPVPEDPVARLWHGATLLREHRGDGHIAALLTEGIGGLESHALHALSMGMPAHEFGRIHHLPRAQIDAVVDGLRDRGLVSSDGRLTDVGRAIKQRVEDLTDTLAEPPYASLSDADVEQLVADLEPLAPVLRALNPF